ncbi:MAG: metallophosphoesterase family protein [Candidatus Omnitrophica bacterium]|nr:metallophosphoesterase family protein [Candidatus Omnitrophota bacterium]
MKIAILSDVHANLPALKSVLAHARARGVREFWDLGDMTGYSPFPDECARLLQKTCRFFVRGNYDEKVISEKTIAEIKQSSKDKDKIFSFVWSHQNLSKASAAFIRNVPQEIRIDCEGFKFFLIHQEPLKPKKADVVLCGHTHVFKDKKKAGVRVINPGSIGRAFDNDYRASYVILSVKKGTLGIFHYRVPYDQKPLLKKMAREHFPARIIRSVVEGLSLEDL